jgi:hypothetical protein
LLPAAFAALLVWMDRQSLLPSYPWSGQREVVVDIEVSRGATETPFEGVLVELVTPAGKPRSAGRTGADGRVTLAGAFAVSGRANIFRKTGPIIVEPLRMRLSTNNQLRIDRPFALSLHSRMPDHRPRIRYVL